MILKDIAMRLYGQRESESNQLWVVGDSVTVAKGILPDQKYYNIVNSQLNLPITVIAKEMSSIAWAADQILRSDIKKNDIVVWGLTNRFRCPYFANNELFHMLNVRYDQDPSFIDIMSPDVLSSDDNTYKMLISIYQVINFCKVAGARLYIIGLLSDELFEEILSDCPDYVSIGIFQGPRLWADLAPDNIHPGPQQHKIFADKIKERLAL